MKQVFFAEFGGPDVVSIADLGAPDLVERLSGIGGSLPEALVAAAGLIVSRAEIVDAPRRVEGLRRQLAPKGIHVLEVLPPTTDTPMNANVTGTKISPAEVAAVTLHVLEHGRPMALPAQTKLLPTLLRIAPATASRMIGRM